MHTRRSVSAGTLMLALLFSIARPARAAGTVTITSVTTSPFTEGLQFSGTVGTFTDTNALSPALLTVTVDWGDGSGPTAPGLVTQVGGGGITYTVSGAHTYATEGAPTIRLTVT